MADFAGILGLETRLKRIEKLRNLAARARNFKRMKLDFLRRKEKALFRRFLRMDVPQLLAEAYVALDCHDELTRKDLRRINDVLIRLDNAMKCGHKVKLSPWMRSVLLVLENYDTAK